MGIMNNMARSKLELPAEAPEAKKLEPTKTAVGTLSPQPSKAIPCSSQAANLKRTPPKRNLMSSFQASSNAADLLGSTTSSAVPPIEHIVSRLEALMAPDSPLAAKVRCVTGQQGTGR